MSGSEKRNEKNNINIKKLPDSEVEIDGEIPADEFELYYKKTIQEIGRNVEISGFRKGHIPEKVLVEKVGGDAILQEMAQAALADTYPRIILENNIEAIGRPEITITKIARGNPLGFKAKTAVLPIFELPDYKTIAKKEAESTEEKVFVEDKEVDNMIEEIRRDFARQKNVSQELNKNKSDILNSDSKQFSQEREAAKNKEILPELTDDFVKQFGAFENVADFKKKIKENLMHEKTIKAKEKKRIAIINGILKKSDISLPIILVESELDRMFARFKVNISAMGHTLENYLAQIKKTGKEMREEWRADAEKSVKIQLCLQKIAEAEKITVTEEEIKKEMEHAVKHYPDADKERVRNYIEGVLIHEKVFQLLERQHI